LIRILAARLILRVVLSLTELGRMIAAIRAIFAPAGPKG